MLKDKYLKYLTLISNDNLLSAESKEKILLDLYKEMIQPIGTKTEPSEDFNIRKDYGGSGLDG